MKAMTMLKHAGLLSIGIGILSFAEDGVFIGKVIDVVSGDTIAILQDAQEIQSPQLRKEITQLRERVTPQRLKKVIIKLYGIHCPETKQALGETAKKFTAEKVMDKKVRIIERRSDSGGVVIGEVYLDKDQTISKELLRAGLAWWEEKEAKDDSELKALQDEARRARKGLWARESQLAPHDAGKRSLKNNKSKNKQSGDQGG
jgi:micrococcal nuclease